MSLLSHTLPALLRLHASASLLSAGFSVLLVLWLVAVEEIDLRRSGGSKG